MGGAVLATSSFFFSWAGESDYRNQISGWRLSKELGPAFLQGNLFSQNDGYSTLTGFLLFTCLCLWIMALLALSVLVTNCLPSSLALKRWYQTVARLGLVGVFLAYGSLFLLISFIAAQAPNVATFFLILLGGPGLWLSLLGFLGVLFGAKSQQVAQRES
ncbi:hypothetical protein [Dictyobacter kobayashii]|uniref:hypothetical protein n=1 Tax=Dictyobacter kobayashii TaxID=2014872 RepID=UPI000F83AFA3|nr:hypothetical protein [Dictyobacter kobayashii]